MGWGQRWPEREYRPKVKKLTPATMAEMLSTMETAIKRSRILSALGVQAKARRGRFHIERPFDHGEGDTGVEVLGRISPLAWAKGKLLLETQGRSESWSEVARDTVENLMAVIVDDTEGRFHGLGHLDKSLRRSRGDRLPVAKTDRAFVYTDSGEKCSVQEALFHHFGVPIPIIAEPREWYLYHRTPVIREVAEDRVLVDFIKDSLSGSFGGTALYMVKDGKWAVFTIKPSDSGNIASAERWVKKRGWKDWA